MPALGLAALFIYYWNTHKQFLFAFSVCHQNLINPVLPVADPWVQIGIAKVYEQVYKDHGAGHYQVDA